MVYAMLLNSFERVCNESACDNLSKTKWRRNGLCGGTRAYIDDLRKIMAALGTRLFKTVNVRQHENVKFCHLFF